MAEVNFFDHFELPWARNGTVEGITDSQWQAGWSFIGATPPSVEQFNKLQQMADEKAAWLYRQFKATADHFGYGHTADSDSALLKALGNHSGVIVRSGLVELTNDDLGKLILVEGGAGLPPLAAVPPGSCVCFVSTTNGVRITAAAGDRIQFNGREDQLTEVVTINDGDDIVLVSMGSTWYAASGTVRLKYSASYRAGKSAMGYQALPSGLIIQWGSASLAASTTTTLTFPIAFPNAPLAIVGSRRIGTNATFNFETLSATQYRAQNTAPAAETGNWLAIGY